LGLEAVGFAEKNKSIFDKTKLSDYNTIYYCFLEHKSMIKEIRSRLGIGDENLPYGATREGKRELKKMAEKAPPGTVAFGETVEKVGTGFWGGRLRRKKNVIGINAQVLNTKKMSGRQELVNEQGEKILKVVKDGVFIYYNEEGRVTNRFVPLSGSRVQGPGENVGQIIRELGDGFGDVKLQRNPHPSPEAKAIKAEIDSQYPQDSQSAYKTRLLAKIQTLRGRQELTKKGIEETQQIARGSMLRRTLDQSPLTLGAMGLKGMFRAVISGGGWGNSAEVNGSGLTLNTPGSKQKQIIVMHENIAGGQVEVSPQPPSAVASIISMAAKYLGKKWSSPIGTVEFTAYGQEKPFARIATPNPHQIAKELEGITRMANLTNIPTPKIPDRITLGDLL